MCGFCPAELILPAFLGDALIVLQASPVGIRCVAAECREGIINHHTVDRGDDQKEGDHAEQHMPTANPASHRNGLFHGAGPLNVVEREVDLPSAMSVTVIVAGVDSPLSSLRAEGVRETKNFTARTSAGATSITGSVAIELDKLEAGARKARNADLEMPRVLQLVGDLHGVAVA